MKSNAHTQPGHLLSIDNNNNNNNNSGAAGGGGPNMRKIIGTDNAASNSSRQEIRITIMLIAVVILFIICQTPTACILVYTAFNDPDPDTNWGCILVSLGNIFNLLMSINSAGNFVLYCLLSQKYRRTFVNMFCPCLARKFNSYLNSFFPFLKFNLGPILTGKHTQTHSQPSSSA